ncbi:MAG: restriction endonuclease subunit S [Candidatus Pacebacteria bacterium]|nr:restriction endonuclease subunit S [Candidatus Paceibacterota bacterium]
MKYCVALNPSYSKNLNDSDSISFIPMECLTNGSICPKTDVVGRVKTGYTFFADGDIIMAKVTPCFENGNIAIVHNLLNGVGFGTSELYVFRSKTIDTVYLFYYLQNDQFKQLCIGTMYGTGGLKRVSLDFIRNYTFYVPPFAKQQQIASFLDTKSSLIDSTIQKEREVIDKLKEYRQAVITEAVTKGIRAGIPMKDSGVEWIGEIPEGWTTYRIKYNTYLKGRIGWQGLKSSEFIDEGPYLVTGTDFKNGRVNWNTAYHISLDRYNEAPEIQLKVGDLLITKDGTVGKLAFIDCLPDKASLNSHLVVLRSTTKKYTNKYLYWVLSSDVFTIYTELKQDGSIMASLSQEKLNNFTFSLPPLSEQQDIVDYLDAKCSAIDATIQKRELAIEKLTAYKQSLIYECVTGKKEVLG